MANTVTWVLEIEEAGVLLRTEGKHVIRVLGAHAVEIVHPLPPMKEQLHPVNAEALARYYSGELVAPDNPNALPDAPYGPDVFITDAGEAVVLQRDVV